MRKFSPFYILSTGRAGSTWLSNTISKYKLVDINLHQRKFSRLCNILCNASIQNNFTKTKYLNFYKSFFKDKIPDSTCDPLQSLSIAFFLLSDSNKGRNKIIHLVRDPRDVITSFMNWKERKLSGKVAHHYTPFWNPIPANLKIKSQNYNKLSKAEKFAWVWNYKNSIFEELKLLNYSFYRFEDLINNDEELFKLFDELEIKAISPINKKKVNQNKSTCNFNNWRYWSPEFKNKVHNTCGVLMRKYGYGYESEWINHIEK